ncbi:MFS transporter [Sphingomonas sp.]|uniref:MFS transporter n=1 Tax=Sphingomonas sp. TaxID=28214 RepID=UPI000DB1B2DF|nr:MFS transporter [Sphingomonas sp.]PZU07255.1 MAG: MFS transporter [Sphingomonas sp.]
MSRWTILAIAWLALLLSFVDRLAWSSVASSVSAASGLPLTALGSFASAFFSGYVISNLVGGVVVDRLGSRIGMGSTLILLGLFTFGFSFIGSVPSGIAMQFLMGLAAGADYAACIKVLAAWFPPLGRARAIGILMTSLPVAVMITGSGIPLMLAHVEWPYVYRAMGVVTLLFGGMIMLLLQDTPGTVAAAGRISWREIAAVLRNPELARLALVGFGAAWGTWGFAFWATALMSKGHGLSPAQAGLATTLFGAAAVIAKPVTGAISDYLGGRRKMPILVVLLLFSIGLLAFGQLSSPLQFQIVATLLGFFGFSWGPILSTLIAEVGGHRTAGTATGATNALQQMGGVVVPLAIGAVFARTHSFASAFATMAAGPILAFLVMALFCSDAAYVRTAKDKSHG